VRLVLGVLGSVAQELEQLGQKHKGVGVRLPAVVNGVTVEVIVTAPTYADDMALHALKAKCLQLMLDLCASEAYRLRITFNVGIKKTAVFLPPGEPPVTFTMKVWPVGSSVPQVVEIPAAQQYTYLGVIRTPGTKSSATYTAHRGRVAAMARSQSHLWACAGLSGHSLRVDRTAFMTLTHPRLTYAIESWARTIPTDLQQPVMSIQRMICRCASLPLAVYSGVTGIVPLAVSALQATVRRVIRLCQQPRGGVARSLAAGQLQEVLTSVGDARKTYWMSHARIQLAELDKALKWNTSAVDCEVGSADISQQPFCKHRPTDVPMVDYDASFVHNWSDLLTRVLLGDPAQGTLPASRRKVKCSRWVPLSEEQEATLLATMASQYGKAITVYTVWHQVKELWKLKSLRGVAQLSASVTLPPFGYCPRSTAYPHRIKLRGGLRCLLGYNNYKLLHRKGDIRDDCRHCGQELTVPHAVMECTQFEETRVAVWTEAWRLARENKLMADVASPRELVSGTCCQLRQWWYMLTIGEEVPNAFLDIGLEGWTTRGGKPESCPNQFSQWLPVYTRLLGVTGKLLQHVTSELSQSGQQRVLVAVPAVAPPVGA